MVNKKYKFKVNNKLKDKIGGLLGRANIDTGQIEINVKAHKRNVPKLASTIKHEMLHVKHPKLTEKEVYKCTAQTKIPVSEQAKLLAKLRDTQYGKNVTSLKKKFKLKRDDTVEPGTFISKMNSQKELTKKQAGIRGLV